MQPSKASTCVVIKRGAAQCGKQDLEYFAGVSAETGRIGAVVHAPGYNSSKWTGEAAPEVLRTRKRERSGPAVLANQAAAPSSNSPATNATCPTISPLASHLTCPLRIMFTISRP